MGHVRAPGLLPGRQADRDVLHLLRVRVHRHPHPRHAPLLSGEHQDGLYFVLHCSGVKSISLSVHRSLRSIRPRIHHDLIMINESHVSIVEIMNVWVCG